MSENSEFLDSVSAQMSPDGRISELRFIRANGTVSHVRFPSEAAASILLTIEQALGQLFQQQRAILKGEDPRAFFALGTKQVQKIQGAVAQGGIPVVSLILTSGVRLDFSVERTQLRELAKWLEELEEHSHKSPEAPN